MPTSLTDYRAEFQERLLNLLWRQWTALGVAGQGAAWRETPLDPEALLLVSCTVARRDPRLFDAMLDWLGTNGRYVNIGRLRRMLRTRAFAGATVYGAIAATVAAADPEPKWARSVEAAMSARPAGEEPLFQLADGRPLPVVREADPVFRAHGLLRDRYAPRGSAGAFPTDAPATLLLRLRALFGVSARCEILAHLLLNDWGAPRAVARAWGYYPATIIRTMSEMSESGHVLSRLEGRQRRYALASEAWGELLLGPSRPAWIVWPALFSALERVWAFLWDPERAGQSGLAQASALRRVLKADIAGSLADSGLPLVFGYEGAPAGEALIPFFIAQTGRLLDAVEQLG